MSGTKPEPLHHMYSRFGGALACFVLGLLCFPVMGPAPFNDKCSHYVLTGYTGCFTWPQFWASMVLIGSGFGFVAFASWASVAAASFAREKQMLGTGSAGSAQGIIGVLALISLVSSILATVWLIKPFETYQTNDHGDRNAWVHGWTIDVWNVTLGYFILVSFLPFAIALGMMLMLITTKPARALQGGDEPVLEMQDRASFRPGADQPMRPASERDFSAPPKAEENRTVPLVSSVVFLLMCFTVTTVITPIWNFSQNSHMLGFSKFAWGWLPLGGVRPATYPHYEDCMQNGTQNLTNCTLNFGTIDYTNCTQNYEQCPWFNFKIYTDTTVFFFALICGVAVGHTLHKQKNPALRKRGGMRMGGEFGYGMTGLEAITFGAVVSLAIFWSIYWGFFYGRFWEKDYAEDLWPMSGTFEDHQVMHTYDTWYIGAFGHGPVPPFEPLAHPQHRRPAPGPDTLDAETPACPLFDEAHCGTAPYCWWNSHSGSCAIAGCTTIGTNKEVCDVTSWCRWMVPESTAEAEAEASEEAAEVAEHDNEASMNGTEAVTPATAVRRLQHSGGGSGASAEPTCVPVYAGLIEEHRTGHGYLHVACRASGHFASLFMSLVVLAAAKGSPLLKAMGLSWEEVLPFHRLFGYVAFMAVTAHMLLWWWKWILDGTFWANIFPDTNYWVWITPVWNHFEDFAVMMVQYSWFLFAAAMAVVPWRREYYRLFYVLHHGAIWMALMGICHAWAFHYFLLPGILLWWADRLTRLIQAAEPVSVTKFQSLKSGVVHLELCAPDFAARFRNPNYGFLRVPGVGSSGWHPFTANVVGKNVTFLIKDMGGWTKELAALAKTGDPKAAAGAALFGPFGGVSARFFPAAPPMVLVGGGIGVTPIASVFKEAVFERKLTSIYFVWIVQSVDLLDMPFVSDLLERAKHEKGAHIRLFVTRAKPAEITDWQEKNAPGPNTKIVGGRPNLPALFDEVDKESGREQGNGAVFACGPDVMQKEAMALGQERNYGESHVETFLF